MLDLPLRAPEITITLSRRVEMRAAPFTDEQLLEIAAASDVDEREEGGKKVALLRVPQALLLRMLPAQIRSITQDGEPIRVAGEPFDATRPEHVAALPFQWRHTAALELYFYAQGLGTDAGKDSKPPAGPSRQGTTRSRARS